MLHFLNQCKEASHFSRVVLADDLSGSTTLFFLYVEVWSFLLKESDDFFF
jgi:hypothetical protein